MKRALLSSQVATERFHDTVVELETARGRLRVAVAETEFRLRIAERRRQRARIVQVERWQLERMEERVDLEQLGHRLLLLQRRQRGSALQNNPVVFVRSNSTATARSFLRNSEIDRFDS